MSRTPTEPGGGVGGGFGFEGFLVLVIRVRIQDISLLREEMVVAVSMCKHNREERKQIMDPNRSLRCYYNWLSKEGLPAPVGGWLRALKDAGYEGVQFVEPLEVDLLPQCRELGLGVCGSGRVNQSEDAFRLAEEARKFGLEALTLHVGWGYEDDRVATSLIESVLDASRQFELPLYVETHRATLFQDSWRAVQFVKTYPDLMFNGDFSHWYTGLEMVYGNFDQKLAFIRPVIERVHFMHGRIGNPGCMQVNLGEFPAALELPFVKHFRRIWEEVFRAYLRRKAPVAPFCFAVELLAPDIYYAREFSGKEESDRWQQSLVVTEIAKHCFSAAQRDALGDIPFSGV
jgi:sugar phosphate isomerase/epimerase